MAPRRPAPTLGQDVLSTVVESTCPVAWVTRAKAGNHFIDYKAMDMKKGVDYVGLSRHSGLLEGIINACPSALVAQSVMKQAVGVFFQKASLDQDPECEAYKIRVMLAHVRLAASRNLPSNLPEEAVTACTKLIGLLDPALLRKSSSTLDFESSPREATPLMDDENKAPPSPEALALHAPV
jgi:hypothetical protein